MSQQDEARYAKACLLVLSICPKTLQRVIDHFYMTQGISSFEDFLNTNKHNLFHLRYKGCCCRPTLSTNTPLYRSQWDILYDRSSSTNPHGQSGECPCIYNAKVGILVNKLDITLCCLIIKNLCPSVSKTDVETIGNARNQLIHASSACLDEPSFNTVWKSVECVLLRLASSVSKKVDSDTKTMLQDLKNQIMNTSDLERICNIIENQKTIGELKEQYQDLSVELSQSKESLRILRTEANERLGSIETSSNTTDKKVTGLGADIDKADKRISAIERTSESHKQELDTLGESKERHCENLKVLEAERVNMGKKITSLANTLEKASEKSATLDKKIEKHSEKITTLETEKDSIKEQVKTLEEDKEIIYKRVHATEKIGKKTAAGLSQLGQETSEIKTDLENLKTGLTIARGKDSSADMNYDDSRSNMRESDSNLLAELLTMNLKEADKLPVSPLQISRRTPNILPVEHLLGVVYIRKDLEVGDRNSPVEEDMDYAFDDDQEGDWFFKLADVRLVKGLDDVFSRNNKLARYVFLIGDSPYKNSAYCLQLMRHWCKAKEHVKDNLPLPVLEKSLDKYDYLFSVNMGNVNEDRSSLVDMLCDVFEHKPEFHEAIRNVLSSDKWRCLVVIHNLVAWQTSPEARSNLQHDSFPNTEGLSNSTIFISGPWEFDLDEVRSQEDRVVQLHFPRRRDTEIIIENCLKDFYGLSSKSPEFQFNFEKLSEISKERIVREVMQIPPLAIGSMQLWYEKDLGPGNSLTNTYIGVVSLMIERANTTYVLNETSCETRGVKKANLTITDILKMNEIMRDSIWPLCILGEFAYQDIASHELELADSESFDDIELGYTKEELQTEVGNKVMEFAIKAGLIIQSEFPQGLNKECERYDFLDRTVKEFLAAVHIVCRDKEGIERFLRILCSLKTVRNFSSVIRFVSGLSPFLGGVLSKHIESLADSDETTNSYRRTLKDRDGDVSDIFQLQIDSYKEIKQNLTTSGQSLQAITYHIPDVFVDVADLETQAATNELLFYHGDRIKSISVTNYPVITEGREMFLQTTTTLQYLSVSSTIIRHLSTRLYLLKSLQLVSVTLSCDAIFALRQSLLNNEVLQSLELKYVSCLENADEPITQTSFPNTIPAPLHDVLCVLPKSLFTLCISGLAKSETILALVHVLPSLKQLAVFEYCGNPTFSDAECHASVARAACRVNSLKEVELTYISCKDTYIEVASDMHQLERITVDCVYMSPDYWRKFLESLTTVLHQFDVHYWKSNIDTESLKIIHTSPCFVPTSGYCFTRVCQTEQSGEDDHRVT